MKRFKKTGLLALTLSIALTMPAFADSVVSSTNLDGISIVPAKDSESDVGTISYADGAEESIDDDYTALFLNGSLMKNSDLVISNDRALVPVRLIAEYFGADVEWNGDENKVVITENGNTINLYMDENAIDINGSVSYMDAAPAIINDTAYVPIRFVSEALGTEVEYSDGADLSGAYIIPRIPQVMISRYDENVSALSEDECIEIVREKLIEAYENKYGEFEPLSELPEDFEWNDEEGLREVITNLEITRENDRYYVMPAGFEFWADKYTGEVYTFYNGLAMTINEFVPLSDGALSFAG